MGARTIHYSQIICREKMQVDVANEHKYERDIYDRKKMHRNEVRNLKYRS